MPNCRGPLPPRVGVDSINRSQTDTQRCACVFNKPDEIEAAHGPIERWNTSSATDIVGCLGADSFNQPAMGHILCNRYE